MIYFRPDYNNYKLCEKNLNAKKKCGILFKGLYDTFKYILIITSLVIF